MRRLPARESRWREVTASEVADGAEVAGIPPCVRLVYLALHWNSYTDTN